MTEEQIRSMHQCQCGVCDPRDAPAAPAEEPSQALCGVPDEDGCCVCVRPLGHPLEPHGPNGEYHNGIGFLSLNHWPGDVHPSFKRDVEGRRAIVDLAKARAENVALAERLRIAETWAAEVISNARCVAFDREKFDTCRVFPKDHISRNHPYEPPYYLRDIAAKAPTIESMSGEGA